MNVWVQEGYGLQGKRQPSEGCCQRRNNRERVRMDAGARKKSTRDQTSRGDQNQRKERENHP